MSALKEAARIAIAKCIAVEPGDIVLVVTDEVCRDVGLVLREVSEEMQAETLFLEHRSRSRHGEEPPIGVAEIMREMDVVLVPTAFSITHTDARRRACKAGARIATMPGVTAEILERCLNADVDAIAQRVRDLARTMQGRSEIHVTSGDGTDLRFSMEGARIVQETGMIRQPGDFGNLPAGKVSFTPAEGSARGNLVINGSIFGQRLTDEPLRIRIEGGRAVSAEGGGETAGYLNTLFEHHGEDARNLAEFGLGAHDKAQVGGNALEDEKAVGTVHFAFGNNRSLGGRIDVPVYEVGVVLGAKVTIDGRTVLEDGTLKL